MKQRLKKFLWVIACLGITLGAGRAEAIECRPASDSTKGTVTLIEPVKKESVLSVVKVQGNLKELQRLIDFVVTSNYLEPGGGDDEIFAPEPEVLQTAGGAFSTKFTLSRPGLYAISVQARILNPDGSCEDLSISRQVRHIGTPHMTVTAARARGAVIAPEKEVGKGGDHSVKVALPTGTPVDKIDLCVKTHDVKEADAGEESVVISAVNTITSGKREVQVRSGCSESAGTPCKIVSGSGFCSGGFIVNVPLGDGKNQIDLFVKNGATSFWKAVDIVASYFSSGGKSASSTVKAQTIRIEPFDVDLKGPDLCVKYLDPSGVEIKDVDGKVLLPKEASALTVDLTLGRCDGKVETVKGPIFFPGCEKAPPPCGSSSVCIQRDNEKEPVVMCPTDIGGTTHYRVLFRDLHFPLNTATITAKDDLGNKTVETHAFGYGNIRPLFDNKKEFNLAKAMVPKGVAGFIDGWFIKGKIKDLLVKQVLNSKKFKEEIFPKLLDPRQPDDEEIACLKKLEDNKDLIGDGKGCTFDHLASKERVVAIKPILDGPGGYSLGTIEVIGPDLLGGSDNKIGLQLVINGFHGKADMYTLQFIDSDKDGVVDTEDEDRDGDHICDRFIPHSGDCTYTNDKPPYLCKEEVGLYGSRWKGLNDGYCKLDKTIPPEKCPDIDLKRDKYYWGCSDQVNDKNGLSAKIDPKGRLVRDPDYAYDGDPFPTVIPVKFAIKKVVVNLDVTLTKDKDGRLQVDMTNPPGPKLVEAIPDDTFPIEFDCGREKAAIYQGGIAGQLGIGVQPWINQKLCKGLEVLNGSKMLDARERRYQGTNKQLQCTFNATLRCSVPKRLAAALRDLEKEKAAAISVKVQDHKLNMDLFAPLGKGDVLADPRGIGFAADGLLIPAGVTSATDPSEPDGRTFLNSLPEEFRNEKFGPIYRDPVGDPVDPMMAAYGMGSEIGLSLGEETINSALHSVSLLLWDLARKEGEGRQSLDLDATSIRKDLDLAIQDIFRQDVKDEDKDKKCRDKNEKEIDKDSSYKCFPFPLSVGTVFGGKTLDYVNPQGEYGLTPVLLRSGINPTLAPTVRLVSVSAPEGWDGEKPIFPTLIDAELEIGLGGLSLSIFEEEVDPKAYASGKVRGNGKIKSWCDTDRFPKVNSDRCAGGKPLPIVTFGTSGRIFVRLLLDTFDKGILRAEAGLSSIVKDGKVELDEKKSHLEFTVLENNTIIPDSKLADTLRAQTVVLLNGYLFDHPRSIRLSIPAQVPLTAFCKIYGKKEENLADFCGCILGTKKDDCGSANALQDAWDGLKLDDFGIFGATLERPLLGLTGLGPSRYLTIGTDVSFDAGIKKSDIGVISSPLVHSPYLYELMKSE